jgi:hypothetical protein
MLLRTGAFHQENDRYHNKISVILWKDGIVYMAANLVHIDEFCSKINIDCYTAYNIIKGDAPTPKYGLVN